MTRALPSSHAHKQRRLSWTFVRALVRAFVVWAELHLAATKSVPDWVMDILPAAERIVRNCLWLMLVNPAAFDTMRLPKQRAGNPVPVIAPSNMTLADFRTRLAKLKAILNNPQEETARLKALAVAQGIAIKKLGGLRPVNTPLAPSTDDLSHACAPRAITPQARPPP